MSSIYLNRNGSDGVTNNKSNAVSSSSDKSKEWQMELLMEKLRAKASQYKTFPESAKLLRMSLLEKRYAVDGVERSQLQKCLDTLQNSIRVTTLNGMVERLESVSRQLGLKFMAGGAGLDWFISSDMFYVEVVLEPSGDVKDVKIHHEGKPEQQSCEELVNCLQQRDFLDFAAQLEGLASIYQLNAEKKVKCKALSALQSLEVDLTTLASLEMLDAQTMLYASPVGILQKRRGGHAMKLTYWVSPYDLLDQKTMSPVPMTVDEVNKRNIGFSVTVCMEGSTAHKLQISPLVSTQRNPNGNNVAVYSSLQPQNSATLPACFSLRLKEPLPLSVALANRIQRVTDMECGDLTSTRPLLSLITKHASQNQLDNLNNTGLYVTLPDQLHCYRMTETKGLDAVMVTNIPFTHPKQVPHILGFLRQQAIFNSLISSCIRLNSRQDSDVILLEVTALSWQQISVSLEHPQEESMATIGFDLSEPSNIKCQFFGAASAGGKSSVTPEYAAKIVQRCMSIPVTMRSLIKRWQNQIVRSNGLTNGNGNFNMPMGNGGGLNDDNSRSGLPDFNGMNAQMKMEPHDNGCGDMTDSSGGFPSFNSPLLGEMASLNPFGPSSSMMGSSKEPVVINLMSEAVPKKKQRKRKLVDNIWRSPKHKGDECEILMETSSNDSTPQGTPTSREAPADFRIPTPTSIDFSHPLEEGRVDSTTVDKIHSELEAMNVEGVLEMPELDVEMLKAVSSRKPKKPREERKSPSSLVLDLEGKSMVPPSVSITPINTSSPSSLPPSFNSVLSGMGLERRPGIEIIPIGSTPTAPLPSSITITPIPPSTAKAMSDERSRERKSRDKSRSEEEEKRLEKKRKRKREDSPMGPPDKVPSKQDPLSKPVSVSIKPTDSPPLSISSRPSSPAGTLRKFSTSPTHTSPLALMSKSASSPGGMSKSSKPPSTQQSPKHSPGYSTSSPKQNPMTSSASPKHGTSSPKNTSGSSGKPSMSTLKSAASSPSSAKSSSSSGDPMKVKPPSSSKDSLSNRDKERSRMSSLSGSSSSSSGGTGSSSGHQSPKPKSSALKMKQLDLTFGSDTTVTPIPPTPQTSGSQTPPSTSQDGKSSSAVPQVRNRKNSLSAVIEKLNQKSTQNTAGDELGGLSSAGGVTISSAGSSSTIGSGGAAAGGVNVPLNLGTSGLGDDSGAGIGGMCVGGSSGLVPGGPISGNPLGGSSTSSGIVDPLTGNKDRLLPSIKSSDVLKALSGTGKPGDPVKNPAEYMVKPGSEGIKLTINKTRTKESSSKSSSSSSTQSSSSTMKTSSPSGSGSPKIHSGHTGLKPGVNSGPASKKPQTTTSSSSGLPKLPSSSSGSSSNVGNNVVSSSSGSSSKSSSSLSSSSASKLSSSVVTSSTSSSAVPKSASSSSSTLSKSTSKSSGSPKLGSSSSSSDPNRNRDGKQRPMKSGAEKSLFSNSKSESRKSSPAPLRDEDPDRTFRAIPSKLDGLPPPFGFEVFAKSLDTKFQIPKLSARSSNLDSEQSKKVAPDKSDSGSLSRSTDSVKALDLGKSDVKYGGSSSSSSSSSMPSSLLPSSSSGTLNLSTSAPKPIEDKPIISQVPDAKTSKPSAPVIPVPSSPSPTPLPKLEPKPPADGSPIPGLVGPTNLTTTGGSSNSDSLDLSVDLTRLSSETKPKTTESLRHSAPPAAPKEETPVAKPFSSNSPAEIAIPKLERARDLSVASEDAKKSLESALSRMEEARSTPPSGPSSQEAAEMLLDFSAAGKASSSEPPVKKMSVTERVMASMPSRRNTPPPPMFPASPSVTMRIVKSPSPLIIPSPQSGSPCITDDDLMDEALVGSGK